MLDNIAVFFARHWSGTTAVFIVVAAVMVSSFRTRRRLPPGPLPIPLLGTLSLLRAGDKRKVFKEMREEYGDIFSFRIGRKLVVVINGFEALREAFVKRADVFSDRPHVFTVDKVGQGKGIVNTSGRVWKEQRKFAISALRQFGFGKASFEDKIQDEITDFLNILDKEVGKDFDPQDVIQTAIANIICSIVFGKRFAYDDKLFKRFLEIFEENMRLVGGTSILNFFPFLKHIPGDLFKFNKVLQNVDFVQHFIRETVESHKHDFRSEHIRDFVDAYLKEMKEEVQRNPDTTLTYEQLIKVIGDLFVGGTETTSTTIRWALIFLVRNHDVQVRMREEIFKQVGRDRRPNLLDKPKLPYTEAAILEIQRLADIAPFSVTHGTLQDVEFRGLFLPQGSIVIPNIHSVLSDPQIWSNPEKFNPERFLDENGSVARPDEFIPFFLGRRVCPGESLARMELFLLLSALVQRYDIRVPDSGQLPPLDGELGLTNTPLAYTVKLLKVL